MLAKDENFPIMKIEEKRKVGYQNLDPGVTNNKIS